MNTGKNLKKGLKILKIDNLLFFMRNNFNSKELCLFDSRIGSSFYDTSNKRHVFEIKGLIFKQFLKYIETI